MKPPFPWFGGKSRVASVVWSRFGDVPNYVEPFAGSLAVLLNRPHKPKIETVNDRDCYLSNFFRATQATPDEVARWADFPVNEADLHARHLWLVNQSDFRERMLTDPDYYDAKIAGWWVWGLCQWIGSGWCVEENYNGNRTHQNRPRPHLGNAGMGVHRPSQQLPHLGNSGKGIHRPSRQMPAVNAPHIWTHGNDLLEYFAALSDRLRRVRVCCGDWSRVLGESPTTKLGTTGVFLDPPYSAEADRKEGLYGIDNLDVAHAVRAWAVANGDDPELRIALCGYLDEHDAEIPATWERVAWKTSGGYGSQGNGRGRDNSEREVVWFSPNCIRRDSVTHLPLFAGTIDV